MHERNDVPLGALKKLFSNGRLVANAIFHNYKLLSITLNKLHLKKMLALVITVAKVENLNFVRARLKPKIFTSDSSAACFRK